MVIESLRSHWDPPVYYRKKKQVKARRNRDKRKYNQQRDDKRFAADQEQTDWLSDQTEDGDDNECECCKLLDWYDVYWDALDDYWDSLGY